MASHVIIAGKKKITGFKSRKHALCAGKKMAWRGEIPKKFDVEKTSTKTPSP